MNCLKCGKDVISPQVFCHDCLEVMDAYPVKPGTPILLTPRAPLLVDKKPRYQKESYSSSVRTMRKVIRRLSAAVVGLSLLVCVLAGVLVYFFYHHSQENLVGKNYTTVESDAQP